MSIFRKLTRKFRKTEETKRYEYVEKDTRCDKCNFFYECKGNGNLIEVTRLGDTMPHFVNGFGNDCKALERD